MSAISVEHLSRWWGYQAMVEDPVFWQALGNNFWFVLGTIPLSVALALLMAVWVNGRLAGRGLLRLAFFTPTVLPMIAVANIWLFFYTPGPPARPRRVPSGRS